MKIPDRCAQVWNRPLGRDKVFARPFPHLFAKGSYETNGRINFFSSPDRNKENGMNNIDKKSAGMAWHLSFGIKGQIGGLIPRHEKLRPINADAAAI